MATSIFGRTREEVKEILKMLGISQKSAAQNSPDLGLLVGTWEWSMSATNKIGQIFFVEHSNGKFFDPVLIANRHAPVNSIVYHEGKIYDAGDYANIYSTLENKAEIERVRKTACFCSYDRKLFDGGDGGIFETLTDRVVAVREGSVLAICNHDGVLYDAGDDGTIKRTEANDNIAIRPSYVWCLFPFDGALYDSGSYGVYDTFSNAEIIENKKLEEIRQMISFNGELVYLQSNGLYSVSDNKCILMWDSTPSQGVYLNCVLPLKEETVKLIKRNKKI